MSALKYDLYEKLRKEASGLKIKRIPFESDWRKKLKSYRVDFKKEYEKKLNFLMNRLGIKNLKKVQNKKKYLILFSGIPGSGKTTTAKFIKGILKNSIVLGSTKIVKLLELYSKKNKKRNEKILKKYDFSPPDPWYFAYIYKEDIIKYCLEKGYNIILPSNIPTKKDRLGYYRLAKKFGASVICIQLYVPFELCCKRIYERDFKGDSKWNLEKVKIDYGHFVFQGEDLSKKEISLYKVIKIDGTKTFKEIRQILTKFFSI